MGQWPPAKKGNGKGKGQRVDVRPLQSQNLVVPPCNRRWRGHTEAPEQDRANAEVRRNPNNVEADCAEQIRKLEQAIEILGRDSPQSAGLENDWMRVRDSWNEPENDMQRQRKQ